MTNFFASFFLVMAIFMTIKMAFYVIQYTNLVNPPELNVGAFMTAISWTSWAGFMGWFS